MVDYQQLKPGHNWDIEIQKSLDAATIIIVFLSDNSVTKRGYLQREIGFALDKMREKLIDDIFIIPVLLDDIKTIPAQLMHIQYIQATDDDVFTRIIDSIRFQIGQLTEDSSNAQQLHKVKWSRFTCQEKWSGLPGYELELILFNINSDEYENAAQISDAIRGEMILSAMQVRIAKFEQNLELFNFGQDRWRRTNTWYANPGEPQFKGRVISIVYQVHWYGAGAAHPNMHFRTFCFSLEPVVPMPDLQDIFSDKNLALEVAQSEARTQIIAESKKSDENLEYFDHDWLVRGTADWSDFSCHSFSENGIILYFAPYQLACYAQGPQMVTIPYAHVKDLIREPYKSMLQIY